MKELEDRAWFPSTLRNFQTDFMGFAVARFKIYDGFVNHLKQLPLTEQPMIDLCSGSGEPAIGIFKKSNCFTHAILTDKFPSELQTQNENIIYSKQSEDVLAMNFQSGNCYTMFNAFHHFKDDDKLKITMKIQQSDTTAFFVEMLEPGVFCFVKIVAGTIIGSLAFTPFIQPFSLKRLLFTYIIPINVLTIFLDGMVSVFKSRSVKQYKKLFAGSENTIEIIKLKNGFNPLIIIQIRPVK